MNRRDFLSSCAAAMLAGCADPVAPLDRVAAFLTAPAGPPVLGINSHLLQDADLRLIHELGFTHVRSTIISSLWVNHPGYAAAMVERAVRVADHGLHTLMVVHNAYGDGFRMKNDPAAAAAFTDAVETMVQRMPEVEAWQLWNEMDVWTQAPFGSGEYPPLPALFTGANYGRWWREAYSRLKQSRPEAQFVTGATADHESDRWRDFLRGMAEREIVADAVAIHVYGRWERARARLTEVRKLFGPGMPIWLTEFGGKPGSHWSPGYQAEAVRSVIEGNERAPVFERIYSYCLETDPNDPWYGLRNVDGSERPVLEWLRGRVAGS